MNLKNSNRNLIIVFGVNLLILLLAFGGLYRGTFNEDTLIAETLPQTDAYLYSGRYVFALIWEVTYRMGFDMGHTSGINVILTVFLLALAVTYIADALYRIPSARKNDNDIKGFLCLDSIVLIVFLNLIGMELLFFSAYALVVGVSAIFIALAVRDYATHHHVRCYLFVMLVIMVYQAYVGIFISFALLIIYLENDGVLKKDNFAKSAIVVLVSGLLSIADIYSIRILKWFGMVRPAKKLKPLRIKATIKSVIEAQINILHTEYNLSFIRFLPFMLLLSAGIVIFISLIRKKANLNRWFYLALLLLTSNLSAFAAIFGGYLYMAPRILVSYWAFICIAVIVALYICDNQKVRFFLLVVTNLVTFLHIINANVLITDLYVSNRLDQNYVMTVDRLINKYEETNGIKIEKIGFCKDEMVDQYWKEYIDFYNYNINERCTDIDWTFDFVLKRFTGRCYEKIKVPDSVYEVYFAGKDWDYFDPDEQMIFDGDTLYLAIY